MLKTGILNPNINSLLSRVRHTNIEVEGNTLGLGLGTLEDIVYIQLLAHDAALRAGLEPGRFGIAAKVTREE